MHPPLILNTSFVKKIFILGFPWELNLSHLFTVLQLYTLHFVDLIFGQLSIFIKLFSYNIGITVETFHFNETVQVFSDPTSIYHSSIKPQ